MIGISEGIVLADRYRLTQRQSERETGASWIAVDLETGSDVWVQFTDHGGLARAAEIVRGLTPPAVPAVLDTGELRMIVDSRALAALRGGAEAHATHVEIVIEFAVIKPLAGRGLPAKILRRALPPAEALAIAAMLAGALNEALAAGASHGWLGPASVWLLRRGGCVLDLPLGLAYPDGSPIALEQQASGYFAPERLAVSGEPGADVGSGSRATEPADVFALGWMLYEMLIGHVEKSAEYERLVAGAGAVTTIELLELWRARARAHLIELVGADSELGALALACLAENPLERPDLAAFAARARSAGALLAGVAPLIAPVVRARPAAAETAAVAGLAGVAAVEAMAAAAEIGLAAEGLTGGAGGELAGAGGAAGEESGAGGGAESSGGAEGAGGAAGVAGTAGAAGAAGAVGAEEQSAGGDEEASAEEAAGTAGTSGASGAAGAVVGAGSAALVGAAVGAGAGLLAGESAGATLAVGEEASAQAASAGAGAAAGAGAGAAGAGASGTVAGAVAGGSAAEGAVGAAGAAGTAGAVSGAANASGSAATGATTALGAVAVAGGEHGKELEFERLVHRARLAVIGGTAAAVVALGVGVAIGYGVGHSGHNGQGSSSTVLTAASANAQAVAAGASSCPTPSPAPAVTVTVTVTASPSAAVSSSSPNSASSVSASGASGSASSAPSSLTSPALPAPSSAAEAITELNQEIQYELGTGKISSTTARRLTTAVGELKNSLGSASYSRSLANLTSLVRSSAHSGELPSNAELTLESILGYFYAGSGS